MSKHTTIFKNDNITLSKGNNGFWLYDKSRGMNLAMRAKTEQDAFVKALEYYSKRLLEVEKDAKNIKSKVEDFVMNFVEEDQGFCGDWHTYINI